MDWHTYPPFAYIAYAVGFATPGRQLFTRFMNPFPLPLWHASLYFPTVTAGGNLDMAFYLDDGSYRFGLATQAITVQGFQVFTFTPTIELPAGWLYMGLKPRTVGFSVSAAGFFAQYAEHFYEDFPAGMRYWGGYIDSPVADPLPATFDPTALTAYPQYPVARLGP